MKRDDVGAMPIALADQGMTQNVLAGASREDLARGYTRLTPDTPELEDLMTPLDEAYNQLWTETDVGGFLGRPHGFER